MKKLFSVLLVLFTLSFVFVSCTKDPLNEQTETTTVDDGEIDDDDI